MKWMNFSVYAKTIALCWIIGTILLTFFRKNNYIRRIGNFLMFAGIFVIILYITLLWIKLEHPPLKTVGDTRLWYSLFLSLTGLIIFFRWQDNWNLFVRSSFLLLTIFVSLLFLYLNVKTPENFNKSLLPALQSVWFVPHVVVYIFGYSLVGLATLIALTNLFQHYFMKDEIKNIYLADNLIYTGFAFLTFGLIFGAFWAKQAWGHYWTWDIKETWALITWLIYLLYIHIRYYYPELKIFPYWALCIAFAVLLISWFGINYLPPATDSIHVYSRN
jgi:ABC-type transport system involved in cytochrome c biogenesis permease subunit